MNNWSNYYRKVLQMLIKIITFYIEQQVDWIYLIHQKTFYIIYSQLQPSHKVKFLYLFSCCLFHLNWLCLFPVAYSYLGQICGTALWAPACKCWHSISKHKFEFYFLSLFLIQLPANELYTVENGPSERAPASLAEGPMVEVYAYAWL